jgi:hypothetical protein
MGNENELPQNEQQTDIRELREPNYQPIRIMAADPAMSLEEQISRAEKYVELQVKMRNLAIRATNINDWIDQEGKPYLQWTGTAKVAAIFGVTYHTREYLREKQTDQKGEYLVFTCMGDVSWQNRSVPEVGMASSRDSFFGVRSRKDSAGNSEKYFLPLSEIDQTNLKKKATTNFLNRGLKSLLGFAPTWEEVSEATGGAIARDKVQQVSRNKGSQGGKVADTPEVATMRREVGNFILWQNNGDREAAGAALKQRTTFTIQGGDDKGKVVTGKSSVADLSEKQVRRLFSELEPEMNKARGNNG